MKVLQVNCVYKKGSTGKIVYDIHTGLRERGVVSVVCYGRGAKISEPHVYKTCGELYSKFNHLLTWITGMKYGGCLFSTGRLIAVIKKEKPDVVHLQCINGYFVNIYRLTRWLKRNHIKTLLTLHAEFMYTANCAHALECEKWKTGCGNCPRHRKECGALFWDGTARAWRRMQAAFAGFEEDCTVVSVSPWLMERAKQSPILRDFHHETVLNGIDTQIFCPREGTVLREWYGLKGKAVALHVTADFSMDPDHIKGGWYVVELAKRMPEVTFVVIGSRQPMSDLPDNVLNIGWVEDQNELAAWYSAADVTLLTSKKETFSMIVAESICCGTPVVGFRAGAPEMIALPEWSEFVEHGDLNALERALSETAQKKQYGSETQSNQHYSKEKMIAEYDRIYRAI